MVSAQEQIEKFKEFLESSYSSKINAIATSGKKSLLVDFQELVKFDHEIAEEVLNEPEETLKAAELSLEDLDIPKDLRVKIRFFNLPKSQIIMIKDIRSSHLNKFLAIEGIVRQSSDVRPQVTFAKFECPSCGNTITIPQLDSKFKEPFRCSCGRKGRFRLLSKELVDAQRLIIEEAPESLEGGEQPKKLQVFLREDLVEPKMEKKTTPGSKVRVYGIIKEIPIMMGNVQSIRYDLMMESNFIEPVEETFEELEINEEDEREIKKLAMDPRIYEKLIKSIAPSIYGHEDIKEALVLQLFGGVKKDKKDGTKIRGDMHILLCGDPGSSKTTLLTAVSKIAPKSRFISGKGVSSAGITATVVKDEFLKGWALEAGALVLANKGILCLHPETEIIFNNQLKKIEELFDEKKAKLGKQGTELIEYHELNNNVPSLKLNSLDVINTNASKIRRKKYSGKLLKISFRSGFSIKLTPDHKLLDGDTLEWKESKKFSVKENIIAPLKLPEINKDIYILDIVPNDWKVILDKEQKQEIKLLIKKEFKTLSEFNKKFNLSPNYLSGGKQLSIKIFRDILNYLNHYDEWKKIPLKYCRDHLGEELKIAKVTPELGYVLGFIYGDGCIKISKRRTNIGLTQSLKHQNYINQFNKCWNKIFIKEMGYTIQKSISNIRGRQFTSISKQMYKGSNLLGKLSEILLGKNLSNLLRLDNPTLSAFIAGVMDSDGCISNKQCSKNNKTYVIQHVDFMFAPKRIKDNLNFILSLRRLDCYGKLIQQKAGYLVEITGRTDVETLKEKTQRYSVKFAQRKILNKITNLSSISQKIPSKIVSQLCNDISRINNKSILIKEGIWSTIYRYKKQQIQPSRDQLLKIKNRITLPDSICQKIDQLIKRDYFLDEIVSVKEEDYEGYVYDLFIPETNNFIAEGIIVHNCLDEMDKIKEEDTSALHEAMESQIISIAKANIQATLRSETTILAAANPKFGRFDPYQEIAKQIDLPPALINRFDLIFTVKDIPKRDTDEKIAKHVLEIQQKPGIVEMEINPKLLKKYISYAKQKIHPKLSENAIEEIKVFYVDLRNSETFGQEIIKPVPITARQLEALVRLAEASAKIRLSKTVTKLDAKRAIRLLNNCLMQVGIDSKTGLIDIDRIATGITASQRSKIVMVREIINEFDSKGKKSITREEILSAAESKNIDKAAVEEVIEKLKKEGEIYEPKYGFISKI